MAENPEAASETTQSQNDQQPTEVEVDGEKINVKEAVTAFKNKEQWQRSFTHRDQELASQRKQLDGMLKKVVGATAPKPAPKAEPVELPDPVEDKGAFEEALKKREAATVAKAEEKAREVAGQAERRSQQQRAGERIVQENIQMADRYLDQHHSDISPQERDAVKRELGHIGGPQYGQTDKATNTYRYNEKAVDKAVRMVDSIHQRQIASAQSQGRNEGLTGRTQGQAAASMPLPNVPTSESPIGERVEFLNNLSQEGVSEVARTLDVDEITDLIHENRRRIEQRGR
tara:strand:- start:39 stop:899 length:861 start_codon:yes stop_codon:yes gene_type:complete